MTDESLDPLDEEAPPQLPWLSLRDGLPGVIESDQALGAYAELLAAGTGPVAIDAERASGYRYSQRAYLVQLRRDGAGTALIDPTAVSSMAPISHALDGTEWILHAATQDLACLAEIDLHPTALFDTELAGRLLGKPRVGLATLVEEVLGQRLRKEHSAADWSTRPLPDSWLEYAALDVEVLIELRAALIEELAVADKTEWARQEFESLLGFTPDVRVEPWRRTSGAHRVHGRRALAAVRAMWEARDQIARDKDVAPGRLLPDAAIVVAAGAMPRERRELLGLKGFHWRAAGRYARAWLQALEIAREMPEAQLPGRPPRGDGPPQARLWADRDPVAARRLSAARTSVQALAEALHVPVENLLTPDTMRRLLWAPPSARAPEELEAAVGQQLRAMGAREWQIGLTTEPLCAAIREADEPD